MTIRAAAELNPHLLQLHQMPWGTNQLTLSFLFLKHSAGDPFQLKIQASDDKALCAISAILMYFFTQGTGSRASFCGPVWQSHPEDSSGQGVEESLGFNRINPSHFKGHNFRLGQPWQQLTQAVPTAKSGR